MFNIGVREFTELVSYFKALRKASNKNVSLVLFQNWPCNEIKQNKQNKELKWTS